MWLTGEDKIEAHGRKTDIWAAGLTIYNIATQTSPFGALKGGYGALKEKINNLKVDPALLQTEDELDD